MNADKCLLITAIILFTVLLPFTGAAAGNISISAEVTGASIPFEGRDTIIVRLAWEGEPFLYQVDDFPMPELEKFKILGSSSSVASSADSVVPSGQATMRTYKYVLEPTDFGTGVIKPLNLTATNRVTEEKHNLQTGRLTVEIARPTPKPDKESLISGIIIFIAAAVIIIVGAAAIIIIRKRKPGAGKEPDVGRRYLEALEEIKKETIADGKLFYSRLYRLLVQYLEKECGAKLSGCTGEEVLREVELLDNESERAKLSGWLDKALKVKFKPEELSSGEIEDTYNAVHKFFESRISNK